MEVLIIKDDVRFLAFKVWHKKGYYMTFLNSRTGFFASSLFVVDDFGFLKEVTP